MQTETKLKPIAGLTFIIAHLLVFACALACFYVAQLGELGFLLLIVFLIFFRGYFILKPNEAKVITFLGTYKGSVKTPGFYWNNPFAGRTKVSLKIQSSETAKLTLPDQNAEQVEIGATMIWKVKDTYKAFLSSESAEQVVNAQSQLCLAEMVDKYPYQLHDNTSGTSLKNLAVMNSKLNPDLNESINDFGLEVLDIKITHLKFLGDPLPSKQKIRYDLLLKKKNAELSVDILENMLHKLASKNLDLFDQHQRAAFITSTISALCQNSPSSSSKKINDGAK